MSPYHARPSHPGSTVLLICDASDRAVAAVPAHTPGAEALARELALGPELAEKIPQVLADCVPITLHGRVVGAEIGHATLVLLRRLAERCRAAAAPAESAAVPT